MLYCSVLQNYSRNKCSTFDIIELYLIVFYCRPHCFSLLSLANIGLQNIWLRWEQIVMFNVIYQHTSLKIATNLLQQNMGCWKEILYTKCSLLLLFKLLIQNVFAELHRKSVRISNTDICIEMKCNKNINRQQFEIFQHYLQNMMCLSSYPIPMHIILNSHYGTCICIDCPSYHMNIDLHSSDHEEYNCLYSI